jgi:hypothetical protein
LTFDREAASQTSEVVDSHVVEVVDSPVVPIVGYCQEFVFSGGLRLAADRLTDLLNGCDEVEVVDVVVRWLDDGQPFAQPRVSFRRSELLAIKAGLPRGNPARRRQTRQIAVVGTSGSYRFDGYLHTFRGADPATDLTRRAPMIPLTHATITYTAGEIAVVEEAATLIVNRDVVETLQPATHRERISVA